MDYEPVADQLIVEQTEGGEEMVGGLYIPDTAQEKPNKGVVLAVGPGPLLEDGSRGPMECEVGDEVVYGEYAGAELELDGIEVRVLREENVLVRRPA